MQWENLTSSEFAKAVKKTKVCIIATGVLEKHSEHLPLGTDFLNGHKIASLAAEKEAAVVFPPFYFGQIFCANIFPGTVTMKPTLLVELFNSVFDEIARNGFEKIIWYNSHGGNYFMINFISQCELRERKSYCLYTAPCLYRTPERRKIWEKTCETKEHGHACECETSITIANYPELVKKNKIPAKPGASLGRLGHLPPISTATWWYANYPDHYAGDARTASKEKGVVLRDLLVDSLAEYIAVVKKDKVVPKLQKEYFDKLDKLSG